MLTLQDVVDFSNVTEEVIDAIAEHEHIPKIVAAGVGNHLVKSPASAPRLKRTVREDIESAMNRGNEHRGSGSHS